MGTGLIVGFPGEHKEFDGGVFVVRMGFSKMHVFRHPSDPASRPRSNQIDPGAMAERAKKMRDLGTLCA